VSHDPWGASAAVTCSAGLIHQYDLAAWHDRVLAPHEGSAVDLVVDLRRLEGRRVSLSLADGTRLDECQLVSVAPSGLSTVWVYADSEDVFLPLRDIRDAWEARSPRAGPQDDRRGTVQATMTSIGGLMIGEQTIEGDDRRSFRVVAIDPTLNRVEAEDAAGALLIDTIDHFIASHISAECGVPEVDQTS
jgi:hypothetical protein